jgi:hypothetical protein
VCEPGRRAGCGTSSGLVRFAGATGIAAGPDGNLWFAEYFGNRIGRITPAGVVTEFSAGISPGSGLGAITAGPDGNLWFTELSGNRIGRIGAGVDVIAGVVNGGLVVKTGKTIELASTGKINGPVTVEPGGALDVQGGKIAGPLTANKAARLRVCGAKVNGPVRATNGSGRVVIGEGIPGCPANVIAGPLTVTGNTAGVEIDKDVITGPVTVTGNAGGTTVTNNSVFGPLTVTGNSGTVVDKPNKVAGPSKLQ